MQDVANCKCEKTLSNVNDLNDQTSIKNSQRTRYVQTINETKTIKQRTLLLSTVVNVEKFKTESRFSMLQFLFRYVEDIHVHFLLCK